MSFILDALRRADAQRESDPARGIHAHPVPPAGEAGDDDDLAGPSVPLARRLLPWAVVLVAVLAALVAWRELRSPERVTRWVGGGDGLAARASPPADPAAPVAVTPAHFVLPPPSKAPRPRPAPARAPSTGLPADAPRLSITGGVHSANAAQRMLVVNGDVVGEGAEPAPGLQVEAILPGAAVLRWRGRRYQVGY